MTMHQKIEEAPSMMASHDLFQSFYLGWGAASQGRPCTPPPGPQAKKRKYIEGWSARKGSRIPMEGEFNEIVNSQ